MKATSCLIPIALFFAAVHAANAGWMKGYEIAEKSQSPNGAYGVLIPGADLADKLPQGKAIANTLVNLKTHAPICVIRNAHYFRTRNNSALGVTWAGDSSWCAVTDEEKWGFDTVTLVTLNGATCTQTDLGQHIQKELNAAITPEGHDLPARCDGHAYFRSAPGGKILVRATGSTFHGHSGEPDCSALFQGTFDIATLKWTSSERRKMDSLDGLRTAYLDYLDEGSFSITDEGRLEIFDQILNDVYGAVRLVLPPERFAEVKAGQIAWLKKFKSTSSSAKKCELMMTRIKKLRHLVW